MCLTFAQSIRSSFFLFDFWLEFHLNLDVQMILFEFARTMNIRILHHHFIFRCNSVQHRVKHPPKLEIVCRKKKKRKISNENKECEIKIESKFREKEM